MIKTIEIIKVWERDEQDVESFDCINLYSFISGGIDIFTYVI